MRKFPVRLLILVSVVCLLGAGGSGFALRNEASLSKSPSRDFDCKQNKASRSDDHFRMRWWGEPTSLNPLSIESAGTEEIRFYVLEGLVSRNERTQEYQPWLAKSWSQTPDGKEITFEIRDDAFFSDGAPVTARDVKFSFDVLFDERFHTAAVRGPYEGFSKAEIVGERSVKFVAKERRFTNFEQIAGLPVLPQHIYGNPDRRNSLERTLVGSGPYVLERWWEGRSLTLKRNERWWGRSHAMFEKKFQPKRVSYLFASEDTFALELLQKGELDFMYLSPELYARLASDKKECRKNFEAKRIRNLYPQGIYTIILNLKNPIFADPATRQALSRLVDRDLMAKRFFRGFFAPAAGPWYKQSRYAAPETLQASFNPQEALKQLNAAGWKDTDRDGLLDRVINGQKVPLSFTILTSTRDSSRFLTLLQEDARQVGVEVNLKTLPGVSMQSLLTSGEFEAVENYAAEGLIDFDPFVVWHSSSTPPQGANYGRYANAETDALLEKSRQELDPAKRELILREVYRKISAEHAQIFLFNQIEMAYAVSKRVGRPADTLEYDIGQRFWWIKNSGEMQAKARDEGRATASVSKSN